MSQQPLNGRSQSIAWKKCAVLRENQNFSEIVSLLNMQQHRISTLRTVFIWKCAHKLIKKYFTKCTTGKIIFKWMSQIAYHMIN